ncbi:MAG: DUF349 domain-containing protein [Actinomycetes bacterium]
MDNQGVTDNQGTPAPWERWGRIDDDGNVWVRTEAGERQVGAWAGDDPAEGLAHFGRRFESLVTTVELLEQRVAAGSVSVSDARTSARRTRESLDEAHAVGDFAALRRRLDALDEAIGKRSEQQAEARAQARAETQAVKERIVSEAESVAESTHWKSAGDRLRELFEEWKAAGRLDKATDDAFWKRFRAARTTFERRRGAHFSSLEQKRGEAKIRKEELVAEAESLADSTEWGPTSRRYRDLMAEWKAAGPAPRGAEEDLWRRFRAAQDTFFGARSAVFAERDAHQHENKKAKEALCGEAESLLPVTDARAAQQALRRIREQWAAIGHVPRADIAGLEARIRKVEQAVSEASDKQWRRSNPESLARAEATVAQLEQGLADLHQRAEKARAAGRENEAAQAERDAESRRALLEAAQATLADLRGN